MYLRTQKNNISMLFYLHVMTKKNQKYSLTLK